MCRRFLFYAGVLIAFGAGLLVGLLFESMLIRLILGLGFVGAGLFLLKR